MFTSFLQYLLLAPSFTNVLNTYAFCNLHDVRLLSQSYSSCSQLAQVSWGTKGSDKAEVLPSISSKGGKGDSAVVEDTTRVQEDVDAAFKETVIRATTKVKTKEVIEKPTLDDQNRTFRTRFVALWMLSNAAVAVAIENLAGLESNNEQAQAAKLTSRQ